METATVSLPEAACVFVPGCLATLWAKSYSALHGIIYSSATTICHKNAADSLLLILRDFSSIYNTESKNDSTKYPKGTF